MMEADRVFTMPIGDEVQPHVDFVETNALRAGSIDVCSFLQAFLQAGSLGGLQKEPGL